MQLIVFSGLPGTGKSTLADEVGRFLSIPVFAKDWLEAALKRCDDLQNVQTGYAGYELLTTLAVRQLQLHQSAVLDSVASTDQIRNTWRALAAQHRAVWRVIECVCSDETVHRARLETRRRNIPGWEELSWAEVERVRGYYASWQEERLVVDMVQPIDINLKAVLGYLDHPG
jgi:predicted kinase